MKNQYLMMKLHFLAATGLLLLSAAGAQAAACPVNYATSPAQANMTAAGGYGQFTVSVPAGCVWSVSPDYPWIVIVSGGSGNGRGVVTYFVAGNGSAGRNGEIFIVGTTPGPNGTLFRGTHYITQK